MKLIQKILGLFLPFAFDATHMNRIHAGTNGLFLYRTSADTNAQVKAANYFDAYAAHLVIGDLILVAPSDAPDMLQVTANDGSTVTVTELNVV